MLFKNFNSKLNLEYKDPIQEQEYKKLKAPLIEKFIKVSIQLFSSNLPKFLVSVHLHGILLYSADLSLLHQASGTTELSWNCSDYCCWNNNFYYAQDS